MLIIDIRISLILERLIDIGSLKINNNLLDQIFNIQR